MIPASCAVVSASPFGRSWIRAAVSGATCTSARATARRRCAGFAPTSTIRTAPVSSTWERSLMRHPPMGHELVEGTWGNREVPPHRQQEGGNVGETWWVSCRSGGSSQGWCDPDAAAAEVDERDEWFGGVEAERAVREQPYLRVQAFEAAVGEAEPDRGEDAVAEAGQALGQPFEGGQPGCARRVEPAIEQRRRLRGV